MSKIKEITARQIKDSRGNPTVEVGLETDKGIFIASCPSGASTGKNEASALAASKAVANIKKIIAPELKGKDVAEQREIDDFLIKLDGTENKSKLGANAILAVSIAACRAGAGAKKVPLYRHIAELWDVGHPTKLPGAMFNILEGGAHADNELDIQEFMVVCQEKTFAENLVLCNKIFQNLKTALAENYGSGVPMGDEGGFAPQISKTEQALYLLKSAIGKDNAKVALDCAASQFYSQGKYRMEGRDLTRAELLEFYRDLIAVFPVISIEDPFSEDDWQGFEDAVRELGEKVLIVGDDLTTTNAAKIKEARNKQACNGVILKLNQIGTVSETIGASVLAKSFGWKTIVSHRSGETMDDFIADFAVGSGADYIKSGSPAKEERMAKYNRLLEIEREI